MFLTDMSIDLIRGAGQVTFTYLGPRLDMFPTRDYSPGVSDASAASLTGKRQSEQANTEK